jgi:hypothetical protein
MPRIVPVDLFAMNPVFRTVQKNEGLIYVFLSEIPDFRQSTKDGAAGQTFVDGGANFHHHPVVTEMRH